MTPFFDVVKKGCTLDEVSGARYDVITVKKGYTPDAVYAILYLSDEDKNVGRCGSKLLRPLTHIV